MLIPELEFLENIKKICQFCVSKDDFSTLVISDGNDAKIYAYPLKFNKKSDYYLLCFPNKEDSIVFSKKYKKSFHNFDEAIEVIIKNALEVIIYCAKFDKESDNKTEIILDTNTYGESQKIEFYHDFQDHCVKILNHKDIKIQYLDDEYRPFFGLNHETLNKLLANAVEVYPKLLKGNRILKYESQLNGKTEYFAPANTDTAENDELVAGYLVFPNKKSVDYFLRRAPEVKTKPGLSFTANALLLKIYNKDGVLEGKTEPIGETEDYSTNRTDNLVQSLLYELEKINNKEN